MSNDYNKTSSFNLAFSHYGPTKFTPFIGQMVDFVKSQKNNAAVITEIKPTSTSGLWHIKL